MASSNPNSRPYVPLPAAFVERVAAGLPGLAESLDTEAPVSVRFNPGKPFDRPERFAAVEPVPWAGPGEAGYLAERPVFTADPVFHGGAYYVQEAGSMFVGWLLRQVRDALGERLRVLDLCAAPGGKTTHLASVVGPGGVVVANEVIRSRAKVLAENVQKWGSGNVAVVSNDPAEFGSRLPALFDAVVVDAPCSGEGMFRKDYGARAEWSLENVQLCAARGRRIVSDAWGALRPGGVLVYSTCTFNAAENEENVRWIAEELGGEVLTFGDSLPDEGIVPGFAAGRPAGWHFYPHRVRSEGFFAAAIRKSGRLSDGAAGRFRASKGLTPLSRNERYEVGRWISAGSEIEHFATGGDGTVYGFSTPLAEMVAALQNSRFHLLYSGVQFGEMIRGGLKPGPALALYAGLNRTAVPVADLSEAEALEYLRKGTSPTLLPPDKFCEGLNIVLCRRIALGWNKRIGRRCNNLYPSAWRILHY